MTAPQHHPQRRALPAVIFIAILTVLTAIVWFRILDHGSPSDAAQNTNCPTPPAPAPTALPRPQAIAVLVLNSTFRDHLASKTGKGMSAKGFHVTQATNDEPSYGGHGVLPGVGEIRYGPESKAAALALHYYLPGATMVASDSSSSTVILALGKKFSHLKAPATVAAELRQHKIVVTKSIPSLPATPSPSC